MSDIGKVFSDTWDLMQKSKKKPRYTVPQRDFTIPKRKAVTVDDLYEIRVPSFTDTFDDTKVEKKKPKVSLRDLIQQKKNIGPYADVYEVMSRAENI